MNRTTLKGIELSDSRVFLLKLGHKRMRGAWADGRCSLQASLTGFARTFVPACWMPVTLFLPRETVFSELIGFSQTFTAFTVNIVQKYANGPAGAV